MASGSHQDDITDLFAGRLYGEIVEKNVSRAAMRRLMVARRAEAASHGQALPSSRQPKEFAPTTL
jgi:hypothetical protein